MRSEVFQVVSCQSVREPMRRKIILIRKYMYVIITARTEADKKAKEAGEVQKEEKKVTSPRKPKAKETERGAGDTELSPQRRF